MSAIVTTLDREIAREERHVGIPTDRPLTDAAIAHRRLQLAAVLLIAAARLSSRSLLKGWQPCGCCG